MVDENSAPPPRTRPLPAPASWTARKNVHLWPTVSDSRTFPLRGCSCPGVTRASRRAAFIGRSVITLRNCATRSTALPFESFMCLLRVIYAESSIGENIRRIIAEMHIEIHLDSPDRQTLVMAPEVLDAGSPTRDITGIATPQIAISEIQSRKFGSAPVRSSVSINRSASSTYSRSVRKRPPSGSG